MRTQHNILIAFLLNLFFSILEFAGGALTGSIAVMSDALHDLGDAASIGFSYLLERKSARVPDEGHTYGYLRYSLLGGLLTTSILLFGSAVVIFGAIERMINPKAINYNGMLILAVAGVFINAGAAFFTREGDSVNQRAVNLHMLEDSLGWAAVLIGAVIMRFTGWSIIDPVMSIAVAVFILINALKNLRAILDIFLEKTPKGISVCGIKEHIMSIEGVIDVHHIHIRSLDGHKNYATMHIVAQEDTVRIKSDIREKLSEQGVTHSVLEFETPLEQCEDRECRVASLPQPCRHHH